MKKSLWYLLSVCLTLGIFASCSDDDKEDVAVLDVNASYEGDKLELKYSDSPLLGKKIAFETIDGKTATITMQGTIDLSGLLSLFSKSSPLVHMAPGVIPGEVTTTLSNVPLTLVGETYTFEGTDTNNGREVKYAGEVTKDKLMMSVNVTMPQNALTGTWKLTPWVEGETASDPIVSEPLTIQWVSSKGITVLGQEMPMNEMSAFLSTMASQPLLEALQNITFKADGNVTASYRNEATKGEWTDSPLNLAWFYIKNDKLYTQLNIDMIMATVEANKKSKAESSIDPSAILALFKEFVPLLSEGVPLNYSVENGKAVVTADETLLLPILKTLFSIPAFMEMISAAIPEDFQALAGPLLEQLPGIIESTTEMSVSLNLEK